MIEYERHRKEGLRLHDLGLYNQAVEAYLEARKHEAHPSLVMLIVSSRLLQGRLPEAIAEMDRVDIDTFAQDDEIMCTGFKMSKAFTTSVATMRYSGSMDICAALYSEHLAPKIPKSLAKQQVCPCL